MNYKIFIANTSYSYLQLRVPSHVSGMRCVFAQNHESERDSNISASLSHKTKLCDIRKNVNKQNFWSQKNPPILFLAFFDRISSS